MNPGTGEVRELAADEPVGVGDVGLRVGDIIQVNGCALKLTAVNAGKRRLSFTTMPRKRADAELLAAERAAVKQMEEHKVRASRGGAR
jgi:hypothetical protein